MSRWRVIVVAGLLLLAASSVNVLLVAQALDSSSQAEARTRTLAEDDAALAEQNHQLIALVNHKASGAAKTTTRIVRYLHGTAEPGLPGKDGIAGAPGVRGGIGPIGPAGGNGRNGIAGAMGLAGAAGVAGADGGIGAQGSSGAPGKDGAAGTQGSQGSAGAAGSMGATGATGPEPASFTFTYIGVTYVCTDPSATGNYTCTA